MPTVPSGKALVSGQLCGRGPHTSRQGRGGAECGLETPARALPFRGGLCGPRASVLHQGLDVLVGAGRKLVPQAPGPRRNSSS